MNQHASKQEDLKVFISSRESTCDECKECARLPKEEREEIEREAEIFNYLCQSHISDRVLPKPV